MGNVLKQSLIFSLLFKQKLLINKIQFVVLGSLESHQARVNRSSEQSLEQAFQTKIDLKKKS